SRGAMRAGAEGALARAKRAAPRMFTRTPKADVIVDPCQAFEEEAGGPGSYVPPAIDGSHPGRYRINLHAPRRTPRAGAEATAFHEMVPGHHFQIALSLERGVYRRWSASTRTAASPRAGHSMRSSW